MKRWISDLIAQQTLDPLVDPGIPCGIPLTLDAFASPGTMVGNATIEGSRAAPAAHGSENPTGVCGDEAASSSYVKIATSKFHLDPPYLAYPLWRPWTPVS